MNLRTMIFQFRQHHVHILIYHYSDESVLSESDVPAIILSCQISRLSPFQFTSFPQPAFTVSVGCCPGRTGLRDLHEVFRSAPQCVSRTDASFCGFHSFPQLLPKGIIIRCCSALLFVVNAAARKLLLLSQPQPVSFTLPPCLLYCFDIAQQQRGCEVQWLIDDGIQPPPVGSTRPDHSGSRIFVIITFFSTRPCPRL